MCFGRLIGAETGLEVVRPGARESVEGQMDKQTDRCLQARWTAKKKKNQKTFFQGAKLFFSAQEKITLINININITAGNKTLSKK